MKKLTVVVPNRMGEEPMVTIKSLYQQFFTDFDIIIINDLNRNANEARNAGFKLVHTPYVLFSDNDINWHPMALKWMYDFLEECPDFSYCWGSYEMGGKMFCNRYWNRDELLKHNYISTMTMVRTLDHPGFDPKIRRLQDWDVWLTMLQEGKRGEYIDKMIFTTDKRDGITRNSVPWEVAVEAIKGKHKEILEY
jgi:glycosyltransferase involved in cell wall biosynthesis